MDLTLKSVLLYCDWFAHGRSFKSRYGVTQGHVTISNELYAEFKRYEHHGYYDIKAESESRGNTSILLTITKKGMTMIDFVRL